MKDIRSLLLVLLSGGLVATWIYHFYDKSSGNGKPGDPPVSVLPADSLGVTQAIRDSLEKTYAGTISELDSRLNASTSLSDSLQQQLQLKVQEIHRLKQEVGSVLQNPRSTRAELEQARIKMKELEDLVQSLRDEKNALQSEKERLLARLNQVTDEVGGLQQNIKKLDSENRGLNDKIKLASTFVASALHLAAFDVKGDTKEQETTQAKRADKFVASFVLQNNFTDFPGAEIMILIIQPDGSILQNSVWDSGTFETRGEGRKNYTRKMRFDYSKGEQKSLIFAMDVENCQKGNYVLEIWHNGMRIAETSRKLN